MHVIACLHKPAAQDSQCQSQAARASCDCLKTRRECNAQLISREVMALLQSLCSLLQRLKAFASPTKGRCRSAQTCGHQEHAE